MSAAVTWTDVQFSQPSGYGVFQTLTGQHGPPNRLGGGRYWEQVRLSLCSACGAVCADRAAHQRFHDERAVEARP